MHQTPRHSSPKCLATKFAQPWVAKEHVLRIPSHQPYCLTTMSYQKTLSPQLRKHTSDYLQLKKIRSSNSTADPQTRAKSTSHHASRAIVSPKTKVLDFLSDHVFPAAEAQTQAETNRSTRAKMRHMPHRLVLQTVQGPSRSFQRLLENSARARCPPKNSTI